jgi:transcriptional regulator with XRE-family HTH domain
MAANVNDKIRKLSPAQRKKVEARAAELITKQMTLRGEEMTLRELRKARKLTQVRLAKALGVTQDSVSRLEKRSDLLLSTLRKTVQAMGGNLSLIAEFPDRAPIVLSGIAEDDPGPKPSSRKHVHAHKGRMFRIVPEEKSSKLKRLQAQKVLSPGGMARAQKQLLKEMQAEWEKDWAEL